MQGRNFDYGHQKSDAKEGQMARRALLTMAKDLYNLYITLNDHDDLPEWCHYKLATSRKDLSDITDYLTSKVMKMCVDKNMSTEDLRLEINNSMSDSILEESFGDFISSAKKKLKNKFFSKKKVELYDILNGKSFLKNIGNRQQYHLRNDLYNNNIIKLIVASDYLSSFIINNKIDQEYYNKVQRHRWAKIIEHLKLQSKFSNEEDRKLVLKVLKMITRSYGNIDDKYDERNHFNRSNLKYRINFDDLNDTLSSLGIKKEYNEESLKQLYSDIDKPMHQDLIEFKGELERNMRTLDNCMKFLMSIAGQLKPTTSSARIKESVEDKRVNSQEVETYLGHIDFIASNEKINKEKEVRTLLDVVEKTCDKLNLDSEFLKDSILKRIKLTLKANLSDYNTYKDILDGVIEEEKTLFFSIQSSKEKQKFTEL